MEGVGGRLSRSVRDDHLDARGRARLLAVPTKARRLVSRLPVWLARPIRGGATPARAKPAIERSRWEQSALDTDRLARRPWVFLIITTPFAGGGGFVGSQLVSSGFLVEGIAGIGGGLVGLGVLAGLIRVGLAVHAPTRQIKEHRETYKSADPGSALAAESQVIGDEMRAISRAAQAHAITRGLWDEEDVKRNNQAIADAKARYQNDVVVRALNLYDRLYDEGYSLADTDRASVAEPRGSIGIGQLGDAFCAVARLINEADSDLREILDNRIRVGLELQPEIETPPAEPEEIFPRDPRFERVIMFHNDTYRLLFRRHPAYAEDLSKYVEDYLERDVEKGREPGESLAARARRSPSAITLRATLDGLREIRKELGQ